MLLIEIYIISPKTVVFEPTAKVGRVILPIKYSCEDDLKHVFIKGHPL